MMMVSLVYLQGNDPRLAGKADAHFNMCMDRFKTIYDNMFYSQVSTVLTSWNQRFPPSSASQRARGSKADDEDIQMFSASDGRIVSVSIFGMPSSGEEEEGEGAD